MKYLVRLFDKAGALDAPAVWRAHRSQVRKKPLAPGTSTGGQGLFVCLNHPVVGYLVLKTINTWSFHEPNW